MKTSDVVARLKPLTQRALASLLGVSPQAVNQWGGTIPQLRVYQLKALKPSLFRKR